MQITCLAEGKSQEIKDWVFIRFLLLYKILAYIISKEKTKFLGPKFFIISIALLEMKI